MAASDAHLAPTVELLAPVPLDLLQDAWSFAGDGELALGSRAWEVFRRLDEIRDGQPVRAWIYASHNPNQPATRSATWTARYVRTVESRGGAHPESTRYRSPIARPEDDISHWAVYWHIDGLRELASADYKPVARMQGFEQLRPYGHPFEPEGPILIEPVVDS